MGTLNERRRAARLKLNSSVVCYLRLSDHEYKGTLRDMSVTGLYLELKDSLQISGECEAEIVLEAESGRLKIECRGTIVRCEEDGVAVHFDTRMEWFPIVAHYFQRMI